MDIEIRKLTPELAEDYVHFFDVTPHDDDIEGTKCYCVCWCNDDWVGKDFSTEEKRREYALRYVKDSVIQGYLAYCDGVIVGWCNANTKADCLKCCSWRRYMGEVPTEEAAADIKVKSIFCYVVAPEMRRKGIAKLLLARVCQDAAADGFDFVEVYPEKEFIDEARDFGGPEELYRKNGFEVCGETEKKFIMRKQLKS